MTEKLARWVFGTATARVSGDTARFLNIAVKSGVTPLELHREADGVRLVIRASQFKTLHTLTTRTHTRVRL